MIQAWIAKYAAALIGAALALAATFFAGEMHERAAWQAKGRVAVAAARATEGAGAAIANTAERDALAAERDRREKADAEIIDLRARLAKQPRCPVPRATVRMLDGARVPATAGAAALAGAAAAGVAGYAGDGGPGPRPNGPLAGGAGSPPEGKGTLEAEQAGVVSAAAPDTVDATAVLENCAWNRLNVAEPNAAQVEELQRFYNALRTRYNKP